MGPFFQGIKKGGTCVPPMETKTVEFLNQLNSMRAPSWNMRGSLMVIMRSKG